MLWNPCEENYVEMSSYYHYSSDSNSDTAARVLWKFLWNLFPLLQLFFKTLSPLTMSCYTSVLCSVSSFLLDTCKALCNQFKNHQFDLLWNVTISKFPPGDHLGNQHVILRMSHLPVFWWRTDEDSPLTLPRENWNSNKIYVWNCHLFLHMEPLTISVRQFWQHLEFWSSAETVVTTRLKMK